MWKTELPPGHSSPAIVGDKIFLTAVRDKEHLGNHLPRSRPAARSCGASKRRIRRWKQIHGIGSYAQPSPAADRERVVVDVRLQRPVLLRPRRPRIVASGDGAVQRRVRRGFVADHRRRPRAAGSGPRPGLVRRRLRQANRQRAVADRPLRVRPRLCDAGRVERRWQKAGRRRRQLRVVGYDFDTGRELWTVRGLSRVVCMTPVIGDDNTLYAAGWSAGGEPGDMIRMEPFADYASQFDENKNGTLEKERSRQFGRAEDAGLPSATATRTATSPAGIRNVRDAVRQIAKRRAGDQARRPRRREQHASRLAIRQVHAVLLPRRCSIRAASSRSKTAASSLASTPRPAKPRKSGRVMGTGNYYASPVGGDGKAVSAQPARARSRSSAPPISGKCSTPPNSAKNVFATPALLDGRIYLRTSGHLYCFGQAAAAQ